MNITTNKLTTDYINLNWYNKYYNDYRDSVEIIIDHSGIDRLSRNIESDEYIMCFVHFEAGTFNLKGIFLNVWTSGDSLPIDILNPSEIQLIIEYATNELKECIK